MSTESLCPGERPAALWTSQLTARSVCTFSLVACRHHHRSPRSSVDDTPRISCGEGRGASQARTRAASASLSQIRLEPEHLCRIANCHALNSSTTALELSADQSSTSGATSALIELELGAARAVVDDRGHVRRAQVLLLRLGGEVGAVSTPALGALVGGRSGWRATTPMTSSRTASTILSAQAR